MSEQDTPPPPHPTPEVPPQAAPPHSDGTDRPPARGGYRAPAPRPGERGQPRERERFPRGERPKATGPVQNLAVRDFEALKPNRRELDANIEAELQAALSGFDISATVAKAESQPRQQAVIPGVQPRKKGTIVGMHGKDVFVDVPGGRGQGVLPIMQFDGKPAPRVGDVIEFDIEGYDAADGLLRLTMEGAAQIVTDWSSVARGMVVEARVTGLNKNKTGLLVEVNGIKGFMPVSQISLYRVENLDEFVNQRLKCEIIEVDPMERKLAVSRRILLERERERQAVEFWQKIEVGQSFEGVIRSIKPFGAFVDLGAADGLIPVSEMSWSRVNDPSEIVSVGQKVEVNVLRLDRDTRKVTLSLKNLVRSPWDIFAETMKVGMRTSGKVTRIADFGAFVEVAPGVEGLVHISELSTQRVKRVRDIVKEGDPVEVEILALDPAARRMSLSLKAIQSAAEAADLEKSVTEEAAERKAALERLAARVGGQNLRGGIGSSK